MKAHPIIAILGSGTTKENSQDWRIAYQIGFLLAKAGFRIVNGGYHGIMEASAKGALDAGGKTIGITAREFGSSKANPYIQKEMRMKRYPDRLFKLIDIADAFVFLNGGTGTIVEMSVVLEMIHKGFLSKPTVILGKRMQRLIQFIRHFPDVSVSDLLVFRSNPKAAAQLLEKIFFRSR